MNGKLEGKVAVITGGNSGIGLATAKRFVAEGAYVFITGRRKAELDAAVREIGNDVTAVQGDIAKLADLDKLYDLVKRTTDRVDILFANAGVAELAPLGEITEEPAGAVLVTTRYGGSRIVDIGCGTTDIAIFRRARRAARLSSTPPRCWRSPTRP